VAVSVLCAPTTEEARYLAGSSALSILQRRTGQVGLLPSPDEAAAYPFNDEEQEIIDQALSTHVIGDPITVRQGLLELQQRTDADELMLSTRTHAYDARATSLRLVAESWGLEPL
jgi:alkanesulfonate monooxygenase SsuD/methylene tetrahydromethanopterin reductase-like flavin-dependent oxidoreductase (luciferase family)